MKDFVIYFSYEDFRVKIVANEQGILLEFSFRAEDRDQLVKGEFLLNDLVRWLIQRGESQQGDWLESDVTSTVIREYHYLKPGKDLLLWELYDKSNSYLRIRKSTVEQCVTFRFGLRLDAKSMTYVDVDICTLRNIFNQLPAYVMMSRYWSVYDLNTP